MEASNFVTFRQDFFKLVEGATNIVITAHYSPDDDSIASVLSMYTILSAKFPTKNIRIVYTGEKVERYSIFYNFEKIEWVDDITNHVQGTDLLIVLDVSKYSRVSKQDTHSLASIQRTIAIDHHASPADQFTLSFIAPEYSSNAELVYHITDAQQSLTKELAELFLLGILGDTGNLVHVSSSQSAVFSIVKLLVETANIRIDSFLDRFRTIPKRIMPLLQEFVKNTTFVDVPNWPSLQYTLVSRDFIADHQFSDEEVSAASHIYMGQYLPRVEGYGWGFVITPRADDTCRMSGRSLPGSVNVRDMHERLGVGGGHDRASGGYFKESDSEKCISTVLGWMKTNTPLLG